MVKITNPLGEVKIGRQGEVVYQRKYGEQIRRQASPKRAMASQAQIAHRQFYRDALDWRKQLSLPNRRYLEGYCIANGVVDGYHIPLPWSRFALKLYLEKVRFVVIKKAVAGEAGVEGKYESYEEGDNTAYYIYGATWKAQTFTPTQAHTIVSVKLKLYRKGSPGLVYVGIKAIDGAGKPTGDDLCSGTIDGNPLTTNTAGQWYEIELGSGYPLAAETEYAIVVHIIGGNADNALYWRMDTTGTYPRGVYEHSGDYGVTWTITTSRDYMFQEFGKEAGIPPVIGLIHIRHPALMTVVQKRGELIVRGYDTLSSLDEEYLTGQVGVDVEAGDYLEATTLPGIKYDYQLK
ncbi:hypothetical protein ES703_56755 [subsurface metagenome]